jgi:hypothetical protein
VGQQERVVLLVAEQDATLSQNLKEALLQLGL